MHCGARAPARGVDDAAEEDVMAQGIQNLRLRCIAQQNSENQIVVLAIQLQLPTAYSLLHEGRVRVPVPAPAHLDKLYLFNSRIDGVLVEQGPNAFMIFTTRKSVERETRGYQDFYLLQMLRRSQRGARLHGHWLRKDGQCIQVQRV